MKKLFWAAALLFSIFEILNVYFIMPMPGSQEMNSIDIAYFLYDHRWKFRILLGLTLGISFLRSDWKIKWIPYIAMVLLVIITYFTNFYMAADHMFYQPGNLSFANAFANQVDTNRLIIGVTNGSQAKAYPIRFIGYHHQVMDTIDGKPILVTYCTVCRSGRVFEPRIDGKLEKFRLVGMDHFNAMLEDKTTRSWWRQVTGEAIKGPLKGKKLPEVFSQQTSLAEWIKLHPHTQIMQADSSFISEYTENTDYETGRSKKKLTGTDSISWNAKSWVIGVRVGPFTKAYDWNRLKAERIIHDKIKDTPILLVISKDTTNFYVLKRPGEDALFSLEGNQLIFENHRYSVQGRGIDTAFNLTPVQAYQEFWHSWKYFNPDTEN